VSESIAPPLKSNPSKNPSYPQRVHIGERAHWLSVLAEWDAKIAEAEKLGGSGPDSERKFAQIAGARDQIANAVSRLPMEVGEMYAEDKHKLEEGVAALERLLKPA
jgi:hypothetical protein